MNETADAYYNNGEGQDEELDLSFLDEDKKKNDDNNILDA